MNTESIIKEILTGIEDAFNELDLPKKPYGRNELWEGITDYFKIKEFVKETMDFFLFHFCRFVIDNFLYISIQALFKFGFALWVF